MILKKTLNPIIIIRYLRVELLISLIIDSIVYISYSVFDIYKISFPFSIVAILGSALAVFTAFRNQSSYSRWWEARTLWGGIVNSSRVFARLIISFANSKKNQANYNKNQSEFFIGELVKMQIAWVHLLRLHLRKQDDLSAIEPFVSKEDYSDIKNKINKPNYLQIMMGKKIYISMANGILGGFDTLQLEGQLLALANYQGGCERIKNTPLLRQYHYFTRLFLIVFIVILPFGLIGDFEKVGIGFLLIPLSVIISFVFAIMAKVGEVNEEPFENRFTDVPLTALCNTIERDLLESIDSTNIPSKIEPSKGFLY